MTQREFLEIKDLGRSEAISTLKDFCNEHGLEEYTNDFIEVSELNDLVQNRLEDSGWEGVACMLNSINYLNDDFYYIDGYGNLREVERDDIDWAIDDIIEHHSDVFDLKEAE